MDSESKKWQNITKPSQTGKAEKDGELIGMLSKQLYLAGDQMQRMQAVLKKAEDRIKIKDQEIGRLKRKVKEWETKIKEQEITNKKEKLQRMTQLDSSDHYHKQCLKLEHKVLEMEKFLADYGLVWLGENRKNRPKGLDTSIKFINDCYFKLVANIEELNLSVGEGEMHVCRYQGGASFKTPASVALKFYKNGMIVGRKGRLRHYRESQTQSFIRDILDGYFPSELQREYPNGVAFKIEDHRTETYFGDGFNYPGHGYQLGKLPSCGQIYHAASSPKVKILSTPTKSSTSNWKEKLNTSNINTALSPPRIRPTNSAISSGILKVSTSHTSKPNINPCDSQNQQLAPYSSNCSDTQLNTQKNTDLTLDSKNRQMPLITRSIECYLPLKEKLSNFKCSGYLPRTPSTAATATRRFNASDSSSPDVSCSRVPNETLNCELPRPRSISLSGSRSSSKPSSRMTFDNHTLKNSKIMSDNKFKKLRATKSFTSGKYKCDMPILRGINESTGEPGELRLKVRSMTGTVVYLVHISADDTVATLYQLLNTVPLLRRTSETVGYKIVISGYATKRLDHMNVTLRDYGINRDSVLHLVDI